MTISPLAGNKKGLKHFYEGRALRVPIDSEGRRDVIRSVGGVGESAGGELPRLRGQTSD